MANVIELGADEQPPASATYYAMVVVLAAGVEVTIPTIRHDRGATFYVRPVQTEVDHAVERARSWADLHHAENVYIQRAEARAGFV